MAQQERKPIDQFVIHTVNMDKTAGELEFIVVQDYTSVWNIINMERIIGVQSVEDVNWEEADVVDTFPTYSVIWLTAFSMEPKLLLCRPSKKDVITLLQNPPVKVKRFNETSICHMAKHYIKQFAA